MPYNIQLPDGTLVQGIPDDIDPAVAKQKIIASRPDLFAAPKPQEDGFFDMVGRAGMRGIKQTGSLLGDVLPAMVGKAVGADEYAARQMAEAEETQKEIAEKYAPRYGQLSDVKGIGDVLPFVAETVTEQLPNLLTSIIPGAGGAVIGGRVAAGQAAKAIAARKGTKEVAEEAAERYTAQAARTGAGRGALGGAFLGSYALNAPEIFQNIEEETGQMEVGASLLAGSVSAALDSILPAALVKQFTPGMRAGVVEKILEKSGMPPGIARGVTAGAITGVATEGPTEAAQEAISIAAEKFVQENPELWGSKEFNRLVESGVRGAVGGGAISGVAGGVSGYMGRPKAEPAAQEISSTKNTFDELDAGEVDTTEPAGAPPQAPIDTIEPEKQTPTAPTEEPLSTLEPEKQTPAAPTEDLNALAEEQQRLKKEITALYGQAKDIERSDPELASEFTEYAQSLQEREREIRRIMAAASQDTLQAEGMPLGGPRRKYPLTQLERGVGEPELRAAGFGESQIRAILANAKPESASPKSKEILRRVAEGEILFNNQLRPVTQADYDRAGSPEERARIQAALTRRGQQGPLLAPAGQQLSFDVSQAEGDVERNLPPSLIEMGEPEFSLERPEGVAPGRVDIEAPAETKGASLKLLGKSPERMFSFLRSINPVAQAAAGVRNYRSAVENFITEIKEFINEVPPDQRQQLRQDINDFFDQYSLMDDPIAAANFAASLRDKPPAEQAQLIKSRTKLPDLTKFDEINAFRIAFNDFMSSRRAADLGYTEEQAAINTFATDTRIPIWASKALSRLKVTLPKSRTPEENAAVAYFGRWNYGMAMRSAAYDLAMNTQRNDMFSGQDAKQAALFKKYVEENLPQSEAIKFNATINAYRGKRKQAFNSLKFLKQQRKKIKEAQEAFDKLESEMGEAYESYKAQQDSLLESGALSTVAKPLHPAVQLAVENGDLNTALDLIRQMPGANRYWSALATRLRELNLPTAIGVDKQRFLVEIELSQVEPSLIKLMDNIQTFYPEVYAQYFEGNTNSPERMLAALQQVKDKNLIPSTLTDNNILFDLVYDTYAKNVPSLNSLGSYFIKQDAINLNSENNGLTLYGLFHETIHAATAHAIRNPEKLNPAQSKALANLKDLYQHTMEKYPDVYEYGFRNLDEFIAEAFTNQDFQSKLRALKYKDSDSSLWSQFIKFVSKLLGGNDSVLFATLSNADILMSSPVPRKSYGGLEGTLNAAAPKSVSKGTFKVAPLPPDEKFARRVLNSILSNRRDWGQAKTGVANFLENIGDATRKYFLGAFTLRQLEDLIGGRLGNAAKNFIGSVESMLEDRNATLDKVSKITKKWEKYQADNPEGSKKLSLLMIDATLAGIDPALKAGKNADLDRAWDSLDPEGKAIYVAVRDFYKERIEEYKAITVRNIELSMIAQNKTAEDIKVVTDKLLAEFKKDAIEPYFPLKRFGRYWFQVGKGDDKEFYMFDSETQRNAFARQRVAEIPSGTFVDKGNNLKEIGSKDLKDVSTLATIEKIIDEAGMNDPIMQMSTTPAGVKEQTLRDSIKDSIQQLYYLTLPNKSVRKQFINRKQISGASQDMLRAFVDSSFHMAYQQSRFKYSRAMFQQLNAAEQLRKDKPSEALQEKTVDEDYIAELTRRLDYIMNPTDTGTIPSFLSNMSFLWYLTAPASALVNMLGVPAIGFPVLAARFGATKAAGVLSSYGLNFLKSGFKNANGEFEMPSLGRKITDPREKEAYDIFVASGLIDITQSHDLAGIAEAPSNLYNGKMNTIMRYASSMFHHAERFNREVMAMSAFRMAYDAAIKAGDTPNIAFKKAVDQAKDLTYRSMFDYSTLNKPRYLQNSYAKVILQFKQFPQHMTYLLGRSAYEWYKDPTPEQLGQLKDNIIRTREESGQPSLSEKDLAAEITNQVNQIRKEGRDRLLGTLGMTFLFAGATGLPLFSVGAATIEALHAAFSDDDEPPLDFENWFKNWLAETFGDFAGDSVSRGVFTQATGLNLADRMSLNDLWFRDPRKSQDEVTALQNMIINLLGPTAGLLVTGAEATKMFNDGQYYRAAERAMPAVLKQPLVGYRYATEGALTLKGDELMSDISGKDALAQSLGFSPEKIAQRQKANIEKKGMEQNIIAERQDLLNAFFMGYDTSDGDLIDRVLNKIDKFNSKYPTYAITGKTLNRSIKTRYKARALAEVSGGIAINKNLMDVLDDMGYYGE
jgi:hypothetical protein